MAAVKLNNKYLKIAGKNLKSRLIVGTGKYKEVVGKKCTYAITFFDEIVFIKAIC